jgi:hypothetical protein
MGQAFVLSGVVLFAITGLVVSNSLYDRGVPNTVSRCAAPVLGGTAYLFAVLWLDAWTATVLSGAMAMLIPALRLGFRRGLRGVRGSLPTQAWSEVTYALAGTGALAVGWGLLGDRWLAFLPIAFMAWGASIAGLARATMWHRREASAWPSIAMLGTCLAAAAVFQPYWIGGIGAIVAATAERRRPMVHVLWDDNLHVVAMSLAVMGVVARVSV